MMRVIAGSARSVPLKTPQGEETRPTQDRIKETLFNIVQADIPYSVVIDGCAGSGAIGIEALSRGASKAYFIENSKEPYECIRFNLEHTKLGDKGVVIKGDICPGLAGIKEEHVDIVFLDPPYGKKIEREALKVLKKTAYVDPETLIIIEADINEDFSDIETLGFAITREKCYKNNKHLFLRKEG